MIVENSATVVEISAIDPGIVHLFALPMCGQVFVVVRLYLYGSEASAAVQRDEPLWRSWMNQLFPPVQ